MIALVMAAASATPLIPDGDQAQQWAEDELADPAYAAAEPTAFDKFATWVVQSITDLFSGKVFEEWGWDATPAVVILAVFITLLIIGLLVWGIPRARSRAQGDSVPVELFGEVEHRSAAQLRRKAQECADRDDWEGAIVFRFRAMALAALERELVTVTPGLTAQAFARALNRAVPKIGSDVSAAANSFDDVRYLRRPGTESRYQQVVHADEQASSYRVPA